MTDRVRRFTATGPTFERALAVATIQARRIAEEETKAREGKGGTK